MKHLFLPASLVALTAILLSPPTSDAQDQGRVLTQDLLQAPLAPPPGQSLQSPVLPPPPPPQTQLQVPLPPAPPIISGGGGGSCCWTPPPPPCGSSGGHYRPWSGPVYASHHGWGNSYASWGRSYSLGPQLQHRYISLTASADRIATLATTENRPVYVSDEVEDDGQQRVSTVTQRRVRMRSVNPGLASEFYGVGFDAYWKADYAKALKYLNNGLLASDRDARIWYYKGFVEIELGQQDEATASLAEAVRLHLASPGQNRQIARALERIQGDARVRLQEAMLQARSLQLTVAKQQAAADRLARRQ